MAALSVALGGSYAAVGQQGSSRPAIDINAPATLRATIGEAGRKSLPIESLPDVHGLDLSEPAKTKLRLSRRSPAKVQPAPLASKGPALMMPGLVEPSDAPLADVLPAREEPATQGEAPPAAPEQFQPEWRPSGKVAKVREETAAPQAPSTLKSDNAKPLVVKQPPTNEAKPAKPKVIAKQDEDTKRQQQAAPLKQDSVAADEVTPEPADIEPAQPLKPLTRNQIYLRNKMRKVLSYYYRQQLNSHEHDTWEAMHMMLAYGLHSRIKAGGPQGESMTAIGWLCYNNPCKSKQLMILNDEGEIRAQYGVGLQGHMGQFLAMLAQCNVDPSYPIRVDGKEFTIRDLIEAEKKTCYPNTELTFKLIALMHYLPSDSQWVNDRGEQWNIEKLIEEELKQPIRGAACGGTHRLGGLTLAVRKRQARGEPVEGVWLQAKQFTEKYEQYLYRLQNPDGSFSTEWFRGPGRESDIDRRCRTTGHLLEWALYQAEDDQLTSYRLVKATNYLTNLLYSNSDNAWEIGPQAHALHALSLYDQRVFQPHDKARPMAKSDDNGADKPKWVADSQRMRTIPRQEKSADRSKGGWWWNR
ncbi:hypothetical protein NG895_17465 [Aeoliella sp. ICT_H6.2]|uniref:Uncharacterized protein n=1 Tax=Aeoliella straminimaris TaxID=2954799 RepID=A0A9X2JK13_9BACT|nr:hypothetical protein [Aeoliella straminimaris]MCO6045689.1 hypothetical protein [Aeoliella straminimaris]